MTDGISKQVSLLVVTFFSNYDRDKNPTNQMLSIFFHVIFGLLHSYRFNTLCRHI